MSPPLSARGPVALLVVIALAGILSFHNALGNGATNFDDQWQVAENPLVEDLTVQKVWRVLSGPYHGLYLPVKILSYQADHALYSVLGVDYIYGVHLTNVILHVLNAFLVALLAMLVLHDLMPGRFDARALFFIGLFSGVYFVVHPAHVESVAWLSGRKDVLSFFFMILSFIAFRSALLNGGFVRSILCVLLFVLALGSKSTVLCFPLIAAAYCMLLRRPPMKRGLLLVAALLAVALAGFVLAYGVVGASGYESRPLDGSYKTHYLTVIRTFPFYMRLLMFPVDLNAVYALPKAVSWQDAAVWWGAFMFLAQLSVVRFVRAKPAKFIVLWYLLSLTSVLHLVPMAVPAFAADRYAYIPSVPFAIAPALILWNVRVALLKRKAVVTSTALIAAAVIYAGALSVGAWSRNRVWKSSETLWADVLSKTPKSRIALVNMADVRFARGDYLGAQSLYKEAIDVDPYYIIAFYNLAVTYEKTGNLAIAKAFYNKTLIQPSSLTVRYTNEHRGLAAYRLAHIFYDEHKYLNARGYCDRALAFYPSLREAAALSRQANGAIERSKELADALMEAAKALEDSDPEKATRLYLNACEVALDYNAPRVALGRMYLAYGQWQEACDAFSEAFLLGSEGVEFEYEYGLAALGADDPKSAADRFSRALILDPLLQKAKVKLAVAKARLGRHAEALSILGEVLQADPENAEAKATSEAVKAWVDALEESKDDDAK